MIVLIIRLRFDSGITNVLKIEASLEKLLVNRYVQRPCLKVLIQGL